MSSPDQSSSNTDGNNARAYTDRLCVGKHGVGGLQVAASTARLFVAPALLLYTVFFAYPLILTVASALLNGTQSARRALSAWRTVSLFVGLFLHRQE